MKLYLKFFLLLLPIGNFGQEINFNIHQTSLKEYLQIENNIGSKKIPNTSTYYSGKGIAQPIRFEREEKIIPNGIVSYLFHKKDSLLNEIQYEWDVYNFEDQDNNTKSKEFEDELIKKYQNLKEYISKEFGQPKIQNNFSNLAQYKQENFFEENSDWKPNDSIAIELNICVSNYYRKSGAITINPVHRIRLSIAKKENLSENEIPQLGKEKINVLDKLSKDFFKTIKSNDLSKSKEFLSDLIKETLTNDVLIQLNQNVDFEKEMELFYSGVQMNLDGNSYIVLQYKYTEDKSNPPSEMIKIVFDNNHKVVGLQPMKKTN
ncbi:MAG: hypothetical protein IT220_01390 [Flavobacteriaceae bacterium]|nr:hypothetical protein [Flavobacteriaceae bacterium]